MDLIPYIESQHQIVEKRFMGLLSFRNKSGKITDADIIAIAKQLGGSVTPSSLAVVTHLTIKTSENRLKRLKKRGVFNVKVNDNSKIYSLTNPDLIQSNGKNPLPQKKKDAPVTESDIIMAAVKADGKLTPGMLCFATNLSLEDDTLRLSALQKKDVFDIVAEEGKGISNVLKDWETYQNMLNKD